jgi:Tfp pilus assembly protein PilO
VISIAIFIGYIWPEIDNFKKVSQEKNASLQSLQDIKVKQDALKAESEQIVSDSANKVMVNNYLPSKRVEEQIIASINYLAADSQVSLVNVSIKDVSPSKTAGEVQPSTVDNIQNTSNISENMQFSEASVIVTGDYDKIRLFLDQMQKMPLFNNIVSLNISNQTNTSNNNISPSNLLADIIVDFGYLKVSSLNNNKIAKFQAGLDTETINTLKQYISQKTTAILPVANNNSNEGKANPFLP